jgi:Cobalamin adenosyltransferase
MSRRDEPVRMTRIYTRAGDSGVTSLGEGTRVSKSDLRVEAYGSVDELHSAVGLVIAVVPPDDVRNWLEHVQNDLFDLGADLAVPSTTESARGYACRRLRPSGSSGSATWSTMAWSRCGASSCPAAVSSAPGCTSRGRSAGEPSGGRSTSPSKRK